MFFLNIDSSICLIERLFKSQPMHGHVLPPGSPVYTINDHCESGAGNGSCRHIERIVVDRSYLRRGGANYTWRSGECCWKCHVYNDNCPAGTGANGLRSSLHVTEKICSWCAGGPLRSLRSFQRIEKISRCSGVPLRYPDVVSTCSGRSGGAWRSGSGAA